MSKRAWPQLDWWCKQEMFSFVLERKYSEEIYSVRRNKVSTAIENATVVTVVPLR